MNDKNKILVALYKILEEYSDEEHILTQINLSKLLEDIYQISVDRRTLYKYVLLLQELGYDISDYHDNRKGYYLRERIFEPSQVDLLCNAVHSSTFIPLSSSKELVNRLLSTQSKYFRSDYHNTIYIDNTNKKDNKEFFLNIEIVNSAIKNKKRISFDYTKYNLNKQLVKKREKPYIISPYYMIYKGEKVFLVGKTDNHEDLTHFRLDKIKNIKLFDENYTECDELLDPYEYAKTKIYMYHGDEISVELKCDNYILDDMIDIFGKSCLFKKEDDCHFIAYVKSSRQGMTYLALQYANFMEVLKPVDLRSDIKDALKKAFNKYNS